MTVYATRLVNGTDSMERMRRTDALGLFPSGPGTARGGFRNDGGGVVTVNAGTMTVSVTPFMAYVDGGVSDVQGGYTFVSDATEALTVSPGHASLSRTDVVIAEVRDTTHDGSGSTDARVRILEGTPGSGVPALPTNALALRNITVPAGLSAGTGGLASGNLGTDRRTYTTGLGGVLPVGSKAERDALPNLHGTTVYRTDLGTQQTLTPHGWETVAGGPLGYYSAATGTSPAFNNTSAAQWTTAAWSFTSTRDGWATFTANLDTEDVAAGYGASYAIVRANGAQVDSNVIRFEGQPRTQLRLTSMLPVFVEEGETVNMTLDVYCFSGAGSWRINSLSWTVVIK